jgi:hypothetical protein
VAGAQAANVAAMPRQPARPTVRLITFLRMVGCG